jgi:hypothetical protein
MSNFDDPFDTDLAIEPRHDPRNVPAVQSGLNELTTFRRLK